MDELFPLLPQWEPVFAIRTGGGYKDNVFLSPTQPQGSAFVSGGGDVMVLRLSPDGPQFSFFASADVNHFLEPSHTESAAFALAKLEKDFTETWQGSLTAEYLFYYQLVDVAFLDPATNVVYAPPPSAATFLRYGLVSKRICPARSGFHWKPPSPADTTMNRWMTTGAPVSNSRSPAATATVPNSASVTNRLGGFTTTIPH
jgi:hypothetical protein